MTPEHVIGELHGVLCPVVTPFTPDGEAVDEVVLRGLVDALVAAGVHGVIPCGSTGEFAALTVDERRQVVEIVADQVAGRVPLVPQVGAMTTREANGHARHAEAHGATAVLVGVPYYDPLSVAEAKDYHRAVAGAVSVPVMLYNIPGSTGVDLTPEDIAELARDVPAIRYVKDTTGDLNRAARLIHDFGDVVSTFIGWDALLFAGLVEGAAGAVLGAANLVPAQTVAIYQAVRAGRPEQAREEWLRLYPLMRSLVSGHYVAAVKAGMALAGRPVGSPRPPVAAVDAERAAELEGLLKALLAG